MSEPTNEALIIAINEGKLDQVCTLLDSGADPNTKDSQGRYALAIASELGNLDIVEVLLAADANLIIQGYDALWAAACNGHVNIVKTLVAAGVPDTCSLVYAYEQGLILAAKTLMSAGVHFDWYYFFEQLENAAITGNLEVIKTLIQIGINVDLQSYEPGTALMSAAECGQLEAVKLLVEAGADVNAWIWKTSETPLLNAADAGEKEVYDYLYPLVSDDIRKIGALIEVGADLNIRDNDNNTAIMYAKARKFDTLLNLLKQAGADEEGLKEIELIEACKQGDIQLVNNLIEAGVNINHRIDNMTPLCAAIMKSHDEIALLLITKGADVNRWRDTSHIFNPLLDASSFGSIKIVRALVEAGANIYLCHEYGYNALEAAERNAHTEIIAYLKELGLTSMLKS